jgi:hypothetical protein
MSLGLTQPLKNRVPGSISGGKMRQASKPDNVPAICERLSRKCGILDVSPSTACYRESFNFLRKVPFILLYGIGVF